ncbi:DUF4340 domain-containing protein [Akkermansia glycaniphila]|uniref:DUF4340 domain-containing protein n=1 Tax=Akkermansia glycaniphila TaxID=1679444 RepID=UPI001C01B440|nr:DUF4340 domain-containing protein [Akkermansia glycaniphila]MBT9450411.1 DUF4340 domain-containing protein [Akkermansia glycaniphila]
MRIVRTIFLSLLAAFFVTAAVLLSIDGNLSRLTGWSHLRPGDNLFPGGKEVFDTVSWMRIQDADDMVECEKKPNGTWWVTKPYYDRMDPAMAQAIVMFSENAKIVDSLPLNNIVRGSMREFGVESSPLHFTLKSQDKEDGRATTRARFTLGSRVPWYVMTEDAQSKQMLPGETVYLRTPFYGRDKRIHVVTLGEILRVFQSGMAHVRDHRPLLFHEKNVKEITIEQDGRKLVVGLDSTGNKWSILSPLSLAADEAAVMKLIVDLQKLSADKISEPQDMPIPREAKDRATKVTLAFRGKEAPVTLSLFLPEATEANSHVTHGLATVSDRDAVFQIPLKSTTHEEKGEVKVDRVGMRDLPLTLSELRSRSFTDIVPDNVVRMSLSKEGMRYPLLLQYIPGEELGRVEAKWLYSADRKPFRDADMAQVSELLAALSHLPVAGFATDPLSESGDSSTDAARFGLNAPAYTLMVAMRPCTERARLFGRDVPLVKDKAVRTYVFRRMKHGNTGVWYGKELGKPSVYEMSSKAMGAFSSDPLVWEHKKLLSFLTYQVKHLGISKLPRSGEARMETLDTTYDYLDESWKATKDGEDVSAKLNPHRASFYLKTLQEMNVRMWLDSEDEEALKALETPLCRITLDLEIEEAPDMVVIDAEKRGGPQDASDEDVDRALRDAAMGNLPKRKESYTIELAPSSVLSGKNGYFYGRISGRKELFTLPLNTVQVLFSDLMEH